MSIDLKIVELKLGGGVSLEALENFWLLVVHGHITRLPKQLVHVEHIDPEHVKLSMPQHLADVHRLDEVLSGAPDKLPVQCNVTVEMPGDAAEKLKAAWERHDPKLLESLKDFKVVSIC